MKVAVVGGIERLEGHYRAAAREAGHELKIYFQDAGHLERQLVSTGAVVVLTATVSHAARHHAFDAARTLGIPRVQLHSSGVSSFRGCLASL